MAGIVFCNLFPAYGKVLFQAGPFTIAWESLAGGVRKALTFEGLVMLSKIVLPPGLVLPGSFGRLLGETFRILERLNTRKSRLAENGAGGASRKKRLIERLDALLLELDGNG
jgi:hypothetical protein